ncbi:MAG: hypothetical protein WC454_00100 [Phycisphaerae bacterium]
MKQNRIKLFPFPVFVLAVIFAFLLVRGLVFGEPAKDTKQAGAIEKGIVILVEFPDVSNSIDRELVQKRFSQQLNNYINEMSYGKVSLDIDVTKKWFKLPDSVNQYKISSRNLEVDRTRLKKLIEDALDAADKEVDFSKYSFAVIFMGAKVADYGMVGLCGYPGMLGWSSKDVIKTRSGQRVRGGVAIFCYQAHLGTLFHDVAHILGGVKADKRMVPCLYDHDLQAKPGPLRDVVVDAMVNMGFWDPMSCHFYKREVPPPGVSSWTKMRLNWIDQSKIKVVRPGKATELVLGPLEDDSSEVLAVKIPLSATTYYLIENRQPIGYDKNLPGSGILIMYADDSVAECRHGKAPVKLMNANASIPHLEGAAFDIGKRDSFRDEKNKITIQLKEKTGNSYRILVSHL